MENSSLDPFNHINDVSLPHDLTTGIPLQNSVPFASTTYIWDSTTSTPCRSTTYAWNSTEEFNTTVHLLQNTAGLIHDNWLVLTVIIVVLQIGGLLLNSTTLVMFFAAKLYRNPSNLLMFNLALSDFVCAAVVCSLLLEAVVTSSWYGGHYGCVAYVFSFLLLGCVSNNTMAVIAIER